MLDVHPPHEKIHGFKDFLLHLLTITIGLLIALSLEGCVERWHHRELRLEADSTIRQEVRDNAKEIVSLRASMAKEEASLVKVIDYLEAKRHGAKYDVTGVQLGFSIGTLSDASWRTAGATGALLQMDYPRVQTYAALYQLQERFDRLQDQTFTDFQNLQSYIVHGFDPDKFSAAEATAAEPEVRRALAHLAAMDSLAAALLKHYNEALQQT